MLLLRLQNKLFMLSNRINRFFDIVFLNQSQLDFSVKVKQQADMFDGVHRLHTIFDIVETFSQRLQAIVCLLPKKKHH
jgi:hypothetical protein